jgi:hypothetical protein
MMAFTNPFRKRVTVKISGKSVTVENATESYAAAVMAFWVETFATEEEPKKKLPMGFSRAEED